MATEALPQITSALAATGLPRHTIPTLEGRPELSAQCTCKATVAVMLSGRGHEYAGLDVW